MENFNFFGQDNRHIPALDPIAHGIPVLDPAVQGIPALNPVVHGIPALNPVAHGNPALNPIVHDIPSLDPAQRVMAKLQETSAELSDKIRAVAEQDSTIVNLRHSVFALSFNLSEHERTLAERDRALFESRQTVAVQALFIGSLRDTNTALRTGASEHDRVVAGLQHIITEQGGTIDDLQRTIAKLQRANADHVRTNSEQGDTIANLQRTVAALHHRDSDHVCTINGLQRTVTDLQHANAGHVQTIDELERANADQQSQLNEAHCTSAICLGGINYLMNRFAESTYGTEIHRQSLDAAIPPPDILADNYDSDITDMVVDIPTAADTVATTSVIASPVIDPQPGLPLPSFDLADTARYESLGVIYDQSGVKVTSERLLAVVKPFTFISLDVALAAYNQVYECQLAPYEVESEALTQTLAKMDGFRSWTPQLPRAGSSWPTGLTFLWRCDDEPRVARHNILKQLGLVDNIMAAIPGPLLCCTLVTLCGMRMEKLTGSILEQMFAVATGEELHSLQVTTQHGTHQMSRVDHCIMVKYWIKGLVEYIAMDNDLNQSLDMTKQCYRKYSRRCGAGGNDPFGIVAAKMLENNEHFSQLFLGIRQAGLKELCKLLVHVVDSGTSPQIKDNLRRVAGELQQRTA